VYLTFTEITSNFGHSKGVIHIGDFSPSKRREYLDKNLDNTIWIDSNPFLEIPLLLPNEKLINNYLSDRNDMIFSFSENISTKTKRFDTIVQENNININNYDFLIIENEIEGNLLYSLENYLSNFRLVQLKGDIKLFQSYLEKFEFQKIQDLDNNNYLFVKATIQEVKLPDQKLIFDIGGNWGLFTDKCIQQYPDAKVIIVEANENLYFNLSEKYSNNKNVVVINYLLSDSVGDYKDFYICDADQISTASIDWINKSRFSNDFSWHPPTQVKTITLDSLIKIFGKPTLIKVDVEGYEFTVLSGLTQKVGEICFEWSEEEFEKTDKCSNHLQSLGYTNFGYILTDDFLRRPEVYTDWSHCEVHNILKPEEKSKWGMIWTF
jgi:FkbM family methyltransferase